MLMKRLIGISLIPFFLVLAPIYFFLEWIFGEDLSIIQEALRGMLMDLWKGEL